MSQAIFIRNPKCATISIRAAINQQKLGVRFDEAEAHQTALQWKDTISDYKEHFIFSVCRNPYDRLLSGWLFICKRKLDKHSEILDKYSSFEDFVLNLGKDFKIKLTEVDMVTWPQVTWFLDSDDKCIIDEIGKFEELAFWWIKLCKSKNWDYAQLRKTNSTRHGPWTEYYTRDMIKVVNKQYADDFKFLDYKML